jgi:hypothetical protein
MRWAALLVVLLPACSAADAFWGDDPTAGRRTGIAPQTAQRPAAPSRRDEIRGDSLPLRLASCLNEMRKARGTARNTESERSYDEGLASEARGDRRAALNQFYEVIIGAPNSPLAPLAYLAFAESFSRDAEDDPRMWKLSRALYEEVTKYPPEVNPAYAYALLRLGDSWLALGESARALDAFQSSRRIARAGTRCGESIWALASARLLEADAATGVSH